MDLALDIAENTVTPNVQTASAMLHLVQAEAFFGPAAFPILFAAVTLAVTIRYDFVSGVSGRKIRAFDPVALLGVLVVAWQFIVSFVLAGLEISASGFSFNRILDGPAFFSFVNMVNQINTVGYTRSAAICVGCLYVVFTIVYTYVKMTRNQHFHDDVSEISKMSFMDSHPSGGKVDGAVRHAGVCPQLPLRLDFCGPSIAKCQVRCLPNGCVDKCDKPGRRSD